MLVDVRFIAEHWQMITVLVSLVIITNTFINAATLKSVGETWRDSINAGTILSQIGEFSFVLAAVSIEAHIITDFG